MRTIGVLLWQLGLSLMAFAETAAPSPIPHGDLLMSVGLCFGIAAILALLASTFKQPSQEGLETLRADEFADYDCALRSSLNAGYD
jgi:hypothetical protein